jgi:hypothetical protein
MVFNMYKSGFLNAVSIGFDPYEWEALEEKDGKTPTDLVGMMNQGTHFTKWDLLEFSAVPVPSNPDALIDRKSYMKTLKMWARDTIEKCESCISVKNQEEDIGGITRMAEEIEKAGAVLSSKNKADLKTASDLILGVLSSSETTPAAPAAPAGPGAASVEPVVTTSYPKGHDVADILKQIEEIKGIAKADDIIQVVDDGEKVEADQGELFAVDLEHLSEITGMSVETILESLTAQAEGDKKPEE